MTLTPDAIKTLEILATLFGVAYVVLAALRNRLCWIVGAVSSACAAVSALYGKLPMQAGLQVFYVGMAVYGWWSWTRQSSEGQLDVSLWPLRWHLAAALVCVALAFANAYWLKWLGLSAWPLLDSTTTFFSVLATWLAARGKLENWLYWVVINGVTTWLFYAQGLTWLALLSVLLTVLALAGYAGWRKRFQAQAVPA